MSLGCYILKGKELLINKEVVLDKSRHVKPPNHNQSPDVIYIYGLENEEKLIDLIFSVGEDHRLGVCMLIFSTLEVHYSDLVYNTFEILKKNDIGLYNNLKSIIEPSSKKELKVPVENDNTNFCTNCGAKISIKNKFCTVCGKKYIKSISSENDYPIKKITGKKESIKLEDLESSNINEDRADFAKSKKPNLGKNVTNYPKQDKNLIFLFIVTVVVITVGIVLSKSDSKNSKNLSLSNDYETLTIFNETDETISVAIGFKKEIFSTRSNNKRSKGWIIIKPNDEVLLDLKEELVHSSYYDKGILWMYAESDSYVWQGDDDKFWIKYFDSFNIDFSEKKYGLLLDNSSNDNSSLKGFFEVELTAKNTEFSFTE